MRHLKLDYITLKTKTKSETCCHKKRKSQITHRNYDSNFQILTKN